MSLVFVVLKEPQSAEFLHFRRVVCVLSEYVLSSDDIFVVVYVN